MFKSTRRLSFLPAGSLSALYYADRLNQLPIGVIGIAVAAFVLFFVVFEAVRRRRLSESLTPIWVTCAVVVLVHDFVSRLLIRSGEILCLHQGKRDQRNESRDSLRDAELAENRPPSSGPLRGPQTTPSQSRSSEPPTSPHRSP